MSKKIILAALLVIVEISCSDRFILTPLPCDISYNDPEITEIRTTHSKEHKDHCSPITLVCNKETEFAVLCSNPSFIEETSLELLRIPKEQFLTITETTIKNFSLAQLEVNKEHLLPYPLYVTVKLNDHTCTRYEVNSFKQVHFPSQQNLKNRINVLNQQKATHEIQACGKIIAILAVASLFGYFFI